MFIRLYKRVLLKEKITPGRLAIDDSSKVHHLLGVMRIKEGEVIRVFNETAGEWQAIVTNITGRGKKARLEIEIQTRLRLAETKSGIKVAFSLIKPDRLKFLIEKSVEIGADGFIPLVTDRCVTRDVGMAKMESWVTGAVEQSERITMPKIEPICSLKDFLNVYSCEQIIFCNEMEQERASWNFDASDKIILVGPEGGFTERERNLLSSYANVRSIFLTQNILRSETAAIFAISRLAPLIVSL